MLGYAVKLLVDTIWPISQSSNWALKLTNFSELGFHINEARCQTICSSWRKGRGPGGYVHSDVTGTDDYKIFTTIFQRLMLLKSINFEIVLKALNLTSAHQCWLSALSPCYDLAAPVHV